MASTLRRLLTALPPPLARLVRRARQLAEGLRFRPYVATLSLLGAPYRFYIADRAAEGWYVRQDHSTDGHMQRLLTMARPGDVVLHCGAHHGLLSLPLAARVAPGGAVYCIEPSEANTRVIARNAALNGLRNLHASARAVAAQHGPLRMAHGSHVSAVAAGEDRLPAVWARASTLDGLLTELDIRPDLVVLDIGGLEVAALRAAPRLRALRPRLAIEVHPADIRRFGGDPAELFSLLPRGAALFAQPADGSAPLRPLSAATAPATSYELYVLPTAAAQPYAAAAAGPDPTP